MLWSYPWITIIGTYTTSMLSITQIQNICLYVVYDFHQKFHTETNWFLFPLTNCVVAQKMPHASNGCFFLPSLANRVFRLICLFRRITKRSGTRFPVFFNRVIKSNWCKFGSFIWLHLSSLNGVAKFSKQLFQLHTSGGTQLSRCLVDFKSTLGCWAIQRGFPWG